MKISLILWELPRNYAQIVHKKNNLIQALVLIQFMA